ncbi:MAG: enoyl-CoA hydratase [FCB group bacterium]|nr:enoyl-CoA hydratase [FCB group bacterium]
MSQLVNMTIQEDGMAFITLNCPPVNALSRVMVTSLHEKVKTVKANVQTRVLIISSSARHFCAGLDLKEQESLSDTEAVKSVQDMNLCFNEIASCPFPTISAINGAALGGGAEMTLATDFRVMAESGKIGFPETGLSIIPGAGGTQRLPRLIGPAKAKYWIFSASKFSAEEALEEGVVDFLSSDEDLLETAIELADEFLKNGPLGLQAAKRAIDGGLLLPLDQGLKIEQAAYESTLKIEDRQEAIRAFAEKRAPVWKGK